MLFKSLDYFRVKDWTHVLGLPILGFVINKNFNLLSIEFASVLFLSSMLLAFAYSFDKHYKISDKRPNSDALLSLAPLAIAVAYSIFLSLTIFVLVLIAATIAILYVIPPFRFKRIPVLVTFLNSLGFPILFLIGYAILSPINTSILLLSVFIAITVFPIQLIHELAHMSQDRKLKLVTTPVKLGFKTTHNLISISLLLHILWSFYLHLYGQFPLLLPTSSIGFSIGFLFILSSDTDMSKVRMNIRYLSVILGLVLLMILLINP